MGRLNPWVLSGVAGVLAAGVLPVAAQSAGPAPTFSKDIAPIFQAKCQDCHQPNSIAPMSLITYQDARPWARSIKDRVSTPADAAVAHRPVASACRSSRTTCRSATQQIDTIVRWVDGGAPQGDPKDLPPAKPLVTDNEWQGVQDGFGPPDLVVKSSEYTMPARQSGRLVPPDDRHPAHRAALGQDGRDSSDQPARPARSCTTRSPISC